jgi:photosystem II stability/assembly factor-like uncharacterized protein
MTEYSFAAMRSCSAAFAMVKKGGLGMKRYRVVCLFLLCCLPLFGTPHAAEAGRAVFRAAVVQSPEDVLPEGGVIILTPLDQYSWRVWPGGKIEYSFDNSRTWETQKSGVTTDLTGGFAVSAKVCWVVGRAGTILLTTDRGKHWKKIASPIKGDVAGVFAQDAKRASVWTASHKESFETNDGGVTWTANVSK